MIPLGLSSTHLPLQTDLHLLQALHLRSQLGHIGSSSPVHCHHLALLLEEQHLLLHHVHLHLYGLGIDGSSVLRITLQLALRGLLARDGCLRDVHHSRLKVSLVGKLAKEGIVWRALGKDVADVAHVVIGCTLRLGHCCTSD